MKTVLINYRGKKLHFLFLFFLLIASVLNSQDVKECANNIASEEVTDTMKKIESLYINNHEKEIMGYFLNHTQKADILGLLTEVFSNKIDYSTIKDKEGGKEILYIYKIPSKSLDDDGNIIMIERATSFLFKRHKGRLLIVKIDGAG